MLIGPMGSQIQAAASGTEIESYPTPELGHGGLKWDTSQRYVVNNPHNPE